MRIQLSDISSKKCTLFAVSILFYIITRIVILYCLFNVKYEQASAEAYLFYLTGEASYFYHGVVYKDFFFPYPPLALIFAYVPYLICGQNYDLYANVFYIQILLFDLILLALICFFVKKRLNGSVRQVAMSIFLYSLMGFIIGSLLLDRIDIVISMILFGMLYFATSEKLILCVFAYFLCFIGICIKIMPVFFLPLLFIYQGYNINPARKWVNIIFSIITILLAWIYLFLFNLNVTGGLFRYLGEHGVRGIQVESLWGSCYQFINLIWPMDHYKVISEYGGQDIISSVIPNIVMITSKYSGFLILGLFYLYLIKRNIQVKEHSAEKCFNAFLCVCLILITTQRVLSPQYFLWLLPFASLFLATKKRFDIAAVVGLYLLVYFGYNHYWDYVDGYPGSVMIILSRNILLLALTSGIVFSCIKKSRL